MNQSPNHNLGDTPPCQLIFQTCAKYREAIEASLGKLKSIQLQRFPHGACGTTSDLLGVYLLNELGLECQVASGTWTPQANASNWRTHAWLSAGGIVIDITADQFHGGERVVVSDHSSFHDRFEDVRLLEVPADFHVGPGDTFEHDYRLLAERFKRSEH